MALMVKIYPYVLYGTADPVILGNQILTQIFKTNKSLTGLK